MRVALLGGGGFRVPLVHEAISLAAGPARVDELVLQDVSTDRLRRMEDVLSGIRAERGAGPAVRSTTSLEEAVRDASFVFCAIRVGGLRARIVDEEVPLEHGVLGQETVGPGGIAFAIRTVPVMDRIAGTVARVAPDAWFVNFTNPAGVVTEALVDTLGDRVVGICDSPSALCARVASAVGRPMAALAFDYAGLNHLGWLLAVRERGRDLLPALLLNDGAMSGLDEVHLLGIDRIRELGVIPNEYLVYYERAADVVEAFRTDGPRARILSEQQERFYGAAWETPADALETWRRAKDLRHGTYMAEVRPRANTNPEEGRAETVDLGTDDGPGEAGYAAVASWFVEAASGGAPATLILNAPNRGRLGDLADGSVIEAPVRVCGDGVEPQPVSTLRPEQSDLVHRLKRTEELAIRAARTRSAELALDALAAHPLVPGRDVAASILAEYVRRNRHLREVLA